MELDLLVKKFKQKDVKAFEGLYDRYSKSLSGVIYNIVRDEAVTQELLQDVFVKAWENSETYSFQKGRIFTWLMNIARNVAIDFLRSKSYKNSRRNVHSESFVDILKTREDLDIETDMIGLENFLSKLATKCKAIIDLLFFKGFSQKETSEQLEIPLGTVKTRSRRCLKDLRNLIEE